MKRLFVAMPLPNNLINEISSFSATYINSKEVRITPPENLHLTTCFIGDTPDSQIEIIKDKLCLIAKTFASFELEESKIVLAPLDRNPYMVWLQFSESYCFNRLCATLDRQLIESRPKKTYIPHVTLARFKQHVPNFTNNIWDYKELVNLNKLILFESVLNPTGAKYKILAEYSA